jgi:glucose-6-phosphate 1-dehydrogenase
MNPVTRSDDPNTREVCTKGSIHNTESPFLKRTKIPEPFTLVLFGATGDLAARKLFPALARLMKRGYLPCDFAIVAIGRSPMPEQAFRDDVRKSLKEFRPQATPEEV